MNEHAGNHASKNNTVDICIKQILDKDIEIVIKKIVSVIVDVDAIYLAGGYGRNEGAWIFDEDGYKPYNDLDLILITNTPIDRERLNGLRRDCAQLIDIKWVDIDVYHSTKLRHLKPTQKNYDILNGSRLVYGEDVLNGREIKERRLGIKDIEEQYFTRLWTFFGVAKYFDRQVLTSEEKTFVLYQLSKAVLACIDCVLISERKYATSYKEKVKRIMDSGLFSERNELFKWALKQKLRPTNNINSIEALDSLYRQTFDLYKAMMGYSFGYRWSIISRPRLYRIYNILNLKTLAYLLFCITKGKLSFARKVTGIRVLQNEVFQRMFTDKECTKEWIISELDNLGFSPCAVNTNRQALNEIAIARSSI